MSCHIANKLKVSSPDSDVVDGFCGSGGLAIQLAKCFKSVTCIDIDPV
jgi:trimethylguanosine synthase